jgi:hypothetical protein
LQAQHIGLRALQEIKQVRHPHLDRIDVPAGDLHDRRNPIPWDGLSIAKPINEAL